MLNRFLTDLSILCAAAVLLGAPAHATVLVDEDFNYNVTNGSSLSGVASNGIGESGNFATQGTVDYSTTNLNASGAFDGVNTTGGSITFGSADNGSGTNDLSVALNASSTSQTFYGSYLLTSNTLGEYGGNSAYLTFSSKTGGEDNGSNYVVESNTYYGPTGTGNSKPPVPTLDNTTQSGAGGTNNRGTGNSIASTTLTTYIALFEVTGAGTASQSLTEWLLTSAQYNNFYTNNELNATALSTATVGTAVTDVSVDTTVSNTNDGTLSPLESPNFLNIGEYNTGSYSVSDFALSDANLAEAATAPEPSSFWLLAIGLVGLVMNVRRFAAKSNSIG